MVQVFKQARSIMKLGHWFFAKCYEQVNSVPERRYAALMGTSGPVVVLNCDHN